MKNIKLKYLNMSKYKKLDSDESGFFILRADDRTRTRNLLANCVMSAFI